MVDQPAVYVVGANEDQLEAVRAAASKAGLAFHAGLPPADDPLTHLQTFTVFEDKVISALAAATEQAPVSIGLVRIDQFSAFNRSHGHMCGDLLLLEAAGILRDELPEGADAARFSGDHLAFLCRDTSQGQAQQLASALVEKIRAHGFRAVAVGEKVTATVGLVTYPSSDVTVSEAVLEVLTARTTIGFGAGGDRVAV